MASVHLFQGDVTTKPKQAEAEGFLARRQAESLEVASRKQTSGSNWKDHAEVMKYPCSHQFPLFRRRSLFQIDGCPDVLHRVLKHAQT